jgi:hypothetical protein
MTAVRGSMATGEVKPTRPPRTGKGGKAVFRAAKTVLLLASAGSLALMILGWFVDDPLIRFSIWLLVLVGFGWFIGPLLLWLFLADLVFWELTGVALLDSAGSADDTAGQERQRRLVMWVRSNADLIGLASIVATAIGTVGLLIVGVAALALPER